MEEFIYKEEYQYPTSIMLNVTDDCNLACHYCFVEQHPHYMTLDIAKKAADWAYNNLQKKKELNLIEENSKGKIYFFGGEPMLCYHSIIVPLVNYCNKKYPNIFIFGITTNGTLLSVECIDWFKENNFHILLSIDGNKITQDFNRPYKNNKLQSSFDLIEKNIKYLLKQFPTLCFRSTIYAPTVEHLFENYLYAESLGFKNYEMIEDIRHNDLWTLDKINILKEQIGKIYAYRLNQMINNQQFMFVGRINQWLEKTIEILNQPQKSFIDTNVKRCGLGTIICSIGWDGKIYGCQEQVSKKNNFFQIGDLLNNTYNKINEEKHNQFLQFYINEQIKKEKNRKNECNNCLLKNLCFGNYLICPSASYDLFQDMSSINNITCESRKIYIENSILLLSILSTIKTPEEIKKILKIKGE